MLVTSRSIIFSRRVTIFGQNFYFQSIRNYVASFGTLFSEINITRTASPNNNSNSVTAYIKVPIEYSSKDKMLARVEEDPNIQRESATVTLPTMSFEMTNFVYDPARKLTTTGRSAFANTTTPNGMSYQYNPVPYNIDFKLYIYAKVLEDANKIVEQIFPYFTPDFTIYMNVVPNIAMKIPIVLKSIDFEDRYNGDFTQRRAVVWTLDFTLKGYFYGPILNSGIIKFAITNFYVPETNNLIDAVGNSAINAFVEWQPGLLANGSPTTNAAASVDPHTILVTDDWGYCLIQEDPAANNSP